MSALLEFLRLLRYAQASTSVRLHEADIARARRGLERALAARDAAWNDIVIHDGVVPPEPPAYLRAAPLDRGAREAALRG